MSAISAASILAKVSRDKEMVALSEIYPGYGLEGMRATQLNCISKRCNYWEPHQSIDVRLVQLDAYWRWHDTVRPLKDTL